MDYPVMKHLLGAHFDQDYDLVTGDLDQTFETFVTTEPDRVSQVRDEIRRILQQAGDDASIGKVLDDLGCEIYFEASDGGYRAWLDGMTQRIDRTPTRRVSGL